MNESEAKKLLAYYDIPVAPHRVANSPESAAELAEELFECDLDLAFERGPALVRITVSAPASICATAYRSSIS